MYNNKNIDYVYLLWEDFLFPVKNKETKKTNKMLYPRFTKVIIDYFILKDQSISRWNKMFWHTARDDTMFTSMRFFNRHEKIQVYDVILLQHLTNQAMLESQAYKTYYAYASREKTPKPNQDVEDAEEESNMNDDSEETELYNDGDDLTYPNLSTYETKDQEEEEKADDDEWSFEMTDAQQENVQANQVIEDTRLQTNKLREEAHAENQEFLSQVDSTMKAIIKEQEFKLKKILIDKMETNKSIDMLDIQKNLYNALVESYNSDKDIITSYGDVVTLKRGRKSSYAEEHGQKFDDLEDQTHQEFNTGNDNVTPVRVALDDDKSQWNPSSSLTHHEWHKTKTVNNRPPQP
uniref:Uncharacterized protein n=1 Tax=Tanacetum cinerariifolium TaxID=118510 RepID=A0A699I952_TANCI|nr:hypothetical protein [Tanacetum cinerariifolium]GEZ44084.1 hypothetical protein [Tanacetum cinerariifolium]